MPSKLSTKIKKLQKDQENTFLQQSYQILCQLSERMLKQDIHNILSHPQQSQFIIQKNIEILTQKGKKLFHIDLKHKQIYWEILSDNIRSIKKECLTTKQSRYKWTFKDRNLGSDKVIEVLGKHKYAQLRTRSITNEDTLKTIHMHVRNNAYANFDDFFATLVDLINENLIKVYDGRAFVTLKDKSNKEKIHQQGWAWYSYEMTKFWKMLWDHLKTSGVPEKYTSTLYNDLDKLFKSNHRFRCNQGLTRKPQKKIEGPFGSIERPYANDCMKNTLHQNDFSEHRYFDVDISRNSAVIEWSINSELCRYPYPQNYPLTNTIVYDSQPDAEKLENFRKSMKRPANSCNQYCACYKDDGIKCNNLQAKIECQNHSCNNSQIRDKKDLLCWYKDEDKNESYLNCLSEKLRCGCQLMQFNSFGLDFYTVTILYYLLPLNRIEDGEIVENEEHKKVIIEKFIPYELSLTQNLFLAIKNIAQKREYEPYHYETKVLQKKMIWIRSMELQNFKDKMHKRQTKFPNVTDLKGYYKGLGVLSVGLTIQKGRLIGKFVGELLPPWREEEKQIVSTKFNSKQSDYDKQIKFYCISVQSHYDELNEPKCFSVDPQNVGNFCRSLNHSCDPNCKVQVMVSEGKYFLGVYALRQIRQNQELTFDYMSVTDSLEESINSVCLCSSLSCRGRYLKHQDEIYLGLDLNFLEEKFPMKQRLKKLMRHCFLSKQKVNQEYLAKTIKIFQERKVLYKPMPESLGKWMLLWIRALNHCIQKETEYLEIKSRQEHSTMKDMTPEKSKRLLEILEKEKISILNSKIQKILHLFDKIKDFSPPFTSQPTEKFLLYLEFVLKNAKETTYNNSDQINKPFKKQEIEVRIKRVRHGLLDKAAEQLQKYNDVQKAHFYLQKAFTFQRAIIHKYPDYHSEPIRIWMQNAGKIQQTVEFCGEDLYMVQNLIAWPGQFKRLYKKQKQARKTILSKQLSKSSQTKNDGQMNEEFKRKYLLQQIKQAVYQLDEDRFKLQKPDVVKDKKLLTRHTDFKKLKSCLNIWIQKELKFIEQKGKPNLQRSQDSKMESNSNNSKKKEKIIEKKTETEVQKKTPKKEKVIKQKLTKSPKKKQTSKSPSKKQSQPKTKKEKQTRKGKNDK